jgi:hypothetical protein
MLGVGATYQRPRARIGRPDLSSEAIWTESTGGTWLKLTSISRCEICVQMKSCGRSWAKHKEKFGKEYF